MVILNLLDSFRHSQLLILHTGLVSFVEITLLAKLVPSALGLFSLHFGLSQFFGHFFNFKTQSGILVGNVGNKSDSIVLEDSFFLEFVPLLLEGVHGLFHLEPL